MVDYKCSACGATWPTNYCPDCRATIVREARPQSAPLAPPAPTHRAPRGGDLRTEASASVPEVLAQEAQRVRDEFRSKRRRQWIAIAALMLVAVFVFPLLGKVPRDDPSASLIALLLLAGFVAFRVMDWRCPRCRAPLGRRWSYRYCARCGVELSR